MKCALAAAAFAIALTPLAASAQSCPEPLASARRLVLVTADGMNTALARMQRYEREASTHPWQPAGGPQSALIGRNGMAWAPMFRSLARSGEGTKVEGDRRTPAGIFKIGRPFGVAPSERPGYLQIKDGTVCVNDLESAAYNTITTRDRIGTFVHGEDMSRVPAYRNGLVVDYPTDRRHRAGSCIFIHVRLPSMTGTKGCVAVQKPDVVSLQDFAEAGAVLAILPESARSRLTGCLPN
jgi:D-alanyl-D-alanine dipeptidase